jgi:RHS repeat-associated protein
MSGSLNAQYSLKRFRRARSQRASKRPRTRTKYGYDAAGDTTSYGSNSYSFNQRGRMSSATVSGGTTNYVYNALGQLIEKSGNGATTLLVYDEAGHLLGEYSSTGALIEETIWMGNLPVATLRPNGSTGCTSTVCVFYVHTDHLGTPRKITQPSSNTLAWRWDPDIFGSLGPNQNPGGLGTYVYNLRFPGQYYLPESGLFYNGRRTYDPQTGRYIESDFLGLFGGSYSTYAYTEANPVSYIDPTGLFAGDAAAWRLALERAGLAEVAGLGPEDPLADIAAAAAIVATLVAADPSPSPAPAGGGVGNKPPSPPATTGGCPPEDPRKNGPNANPNAFSPGKSALVDMAQLDAYLGITRADMDAYIQLNSELPDPFVSDMVRLDSGGVKGGAHSRVPHGRVGPINHIPIVDP